VNADILLFDVGQQRLKARHVEYIAKALPVRFEHDRKPLVSRGDGEQVGRLTALHP
jgi:hypothetical protein